MKKLLSLMLATLLVAAVSTPGNACTGIAITAADGTKILARTIEWKGGNLNSKLVIMPRGMENTALTPEGQNGHKWVNKYGAVGANVLPRAAQNAVAQKLERQPLVRLTYGGNLRDAAHLGMILRKRALRLLQKEQRRGLQPLII